MSSKKDSKKSNLKKKPYQKPRLKKYNEFVEATSGFGVGGPPAGASAAAQASPTVPGQTVFLVRLSLIGWEPVHYSDFFIGIELTRHCNLRCQHCLRDDLDKHAEVPVEFVKKLLKQARAYNKPHIALTGGEATLHSKFGEIIDLIVSEGYTFHFVTNGTTFPRVFQRLQAYAGGRAWRGISLSMDGATEETMDKIRGKGVYQKAIQAIAIAKTHRVPVTAQMVVNRLNRPEMRNDG